MIESHQANRFVGVIVGQPIRQPKCYVKENLVTNRCILATLYQIPCQLSVCAIDSTFVLPNHYSNRYVSEKPLSTILTDYWPILWYSEPILSYWFGQIRIGVAKIPHPSSGNKEYPLQWKLRVDPSSGNMVVIRQTPAVEIRRMKNVRRRNSKI